MKKNKIKEINRKLVVVGDGYCGKNKLFFIQNQSNLLILVNYVNSFLLFR